MSGKHVSITANHHFVLSKIQSLITLSHPFSLMDSNWSFALITHDEHVDAQMDPNLTLFWACGWFGGLSLNCNTEWQVVFSDFPYKFGIKAVSGIATKWDMWVCLRVAVPTIDYCCSRCGSNFRDSNLWPFFIRWWYITMLILLFQIIFWCAWMNIADRPSATGVR